MERLAMICIIYKTDDARLLLDQPCISQNFNCAKQQDMSDSKLIL